MRTTLAIAVLLCLLPLGACRTASPRPIQVAYGEQLDQLRPGMSVEEFRRIVPRAREFQRTYSAIGTISVYRLTHRYRQDDFPPETQELYFRFVNDKLNRWGYSQTWGKGG